MGNFNQQLMCLEGDLIYVRKAYWKVLFHNRYANDKYLFMPEETKWAFRLPTLGPGNRDTMLISTTHCANGAPLARQHFTVIGMGDGYQRLCPFIEGATIEIGHPVFGNDVVNV